MGVERLESITRQLLDAGADAAAARRADPLGHHRRASKPSPARSPTSPRRAADGGFEAPGRRGVRRGRAAARGVELVREPPAVRQAHRRHAHPQAGRGAQRQAARARGGRASKSPPSASSRPRSCASSPNWSRTPTPTTGSSSPAPTAWTRSFDWFYRLFQDARDIGGARIAAVGPATAARVREFHLKVDVQPETAVAEALVEALQEEGSVENLNILLVRPEVDARGRRPGTDQARGHRGRGHRLPHRARNGRRRRPARASGGAGAFPARGRGHGHVRQFGSAWKISSP